MNLINISMITILSILIIASGCTDPKVIIIATDPKDNNQLFPNIDARSFADEHFYEKKYRDHEFSLAISSEWGSQGGYTDSIEAWTELEWYEKINYLPSGGFFKHELPIRHDRDTDISLDQQYYEMIGKYIRQFGIGWDAHVDDFPFDDPSTPHYDRRRIFSEIYVDMW